MASVRIECIAAEGNFELLGAAVAGPAIFATLDYPRPSRAVAPRACSPGGSRTSQSGAVGRTSLTTWVPSGLQGGVRAGRARCAQKSPSSRPKCFSASSARAELSHSDFLLRPTSTIGLEWLHFGARASFVGTRRVREGSGRRCRAARDLFALRIRAMLPAS